MACGPGALSALPNRQRGRAVGGDGKPRRDKRGHEGFANAAQWGFRGGQREGSQGEDGFGDGEWREGVHRTVESGPAPQAPPAHRALATLIRAD